MAARVASTIVVQKTSVGLCDLCLAGGLALQVLDLSWNSCGHACAMELLDVIRRCPSLKAAAFEGIGFDGRPGTGAVLDVALRSGALVHVGVSLLEVTDVPGPSGVTSDAIHAVTVASRQTSSTPTAVPTPALPVPRAQAQPTAGDRHSGAGHEA